jgi:hypothetical protein
MPPGKEQRQFECARGKKSGQRPKNQKHAGNHKANDYKGLTNRMEWQGAVDWTPPEPRVCSKDLG